MACTNWHDPNRVRYTKIQSEVTSEQRCASHVVNKYRNRPRVFTKTKFNRFDGRLSSKKAENGKRFSRRVFENSKPLNQFRYPVRTFNNNKLRYSTLRPKMINTTNDSDVDTTEIHLDPKAEETSISEQANRQPSQETSSSDNLCDLASVNTELIMINEYISKHIEELNSRIQYFNIDIEVKRKQYGTPKVQQKETPSKNESENKLASIQDSSEPKPLSSAGAITGPSDTISGPSDQISGPSFVSTSKFIRTKGTTSFAKTNKPIRSNCNLNNNTEKPKSNARVGSNEVNVEGVVKGEQNDTKKTNSKTRNDIGIYIPPGERNKQFQKSKSFGERNNVGHNYGKKNKPPNYVSRKQPTRYRSKSACSHTSAPKMITPHGDCNNDSQYKTANKDMNDCLKFLSPSMFYAIQDAINCSNLEASHNYRIRVNVVEKITQYYLTNNYIRQCNIVIDSIVLMATTVKGCRRNGVELLNALANEVKTRRDKKSFIQILITRSMRNLESLTYFVKCTGHGCDLHTFFYFYSELFVNLSTKNTILIKSISCKIKELFIILLRNDPGSINCLAQIMKHTGARLYVMECKFGKQAISMDAVFKDLKQLVDSGKIKEKKTRTRVIKVMEMFCSKRESGKSVPSNEKSSNEDLDEL